MYCTNCGHKNEDTSKYCVECGKELVNTNVGSKVKKQAKQKIKKDRGKLVGFFIFLVIIGCSFGTIYVFNIDFNPDHKKLYSAYYQKYLEKVAEFGEGELVNSVSGDYGYLDGVCAANLFDFNRDGTEDLFLVYFNGMFPGEDSNGLRVPTSESYNIEVWSMQGEELQLVFNKDHVGRFHPNTVDSSEICYVTVFNFGIPVIQLYEDSSEFGDGCTYTNYYCTEEGKLQERKFAYSDGCFYDDGVIVDEKQWTLNVADFDRILMCIPLSGPCQENTFERYGYTYDDAISALDNFTQKLSKSKKAEYRIASDDYTDIYLEVLSQYNRKYEDSDSSVPFVYDLYDLNEDAIPELIIREGMCEADYRYCVYRYDGFLNAELCGSFGGSHLRLYVDGKKDLVGYFTQMGGFAITRYTLEDGVLVEEHIADGYIEGEAPALSEYGLEDFDTLLKKCSVSMPILLYND